MKYDPSYATLIKHHAKKVVQGIIFPDLEVENKKNTFNVRYFDVTWEDLNSEKFLEELQINNLIINMDFHQLR